MMVTVVFQCLNYEENSSMTGDLGVRALSPLKERGERRRSGKGERRGRSKEGKEGSTTQHSSVKEILILISLS